MTDGMSAQGTKLEVSPDPTWPPSAPVGGSVTFTEIAELGDFNPPPLTRNKIELPAHNLQAEKSVVGIRRLGDASASLNFIPTDDSHDHNAGLIKKWKDGTRNIYRVTYPDQSKMMWSGFVTNVAPSAPVDDRLSADVTWSVTGDPAFVDPS